jgi:hypothetical protein
MHSPLKGQTSMKRLVFRLIAFSFATLGAVSLLALPRNGREATREEYKVYEAVLGLMDHIPKEDPRVSIFNATLNSKCGEDDNPAPLVNGCTFLWMKPDTANSVKALLREEWSDMEDSTWSNFEKSNTASALLHEPISTPWKHKLIGPGDEPSKDWESPDMTIFLSGVGFNQKKTEAVVYVLIFSYMDEVGTAGDYFLFRVDKTGHWKPDGRVNYFTKEKNQSPQ